MRKNIVIALAITSSFALTACGNDHKGSGQAHVAAAKTKVQAAKVTGDKKDQKANFDDIMGQIEAKRVELRQHKFYAADEETSEVGVVVGYVDNVKGTPKSVRDFAVPTLKEMKGLSEALVTAAKDLKDDAKIAQAEETKATIESALEKAEHRKGVSVAMFKRAWATVVSGALAAPSATLAVANATPGALNSAVEYGKATPVVGTAMGYVAAGTNYVVSKVKPEEKPQTGKFFDIKAKIDEQVKTLDQMGYHDQDDQYSFGQVYSDAKNLFKTRSADELAKIKSILESVKADLDQLVITANENNDDTQKVVSVYLFNLAKSNIATVEKAQKKQEKAAFKAQQKKETQESKSSAPADTVPWDAYSTPM